MEITFDIETRPCDDAGLIAELTQQAALEAEEAMACVKAPANYKDEAKIAEYISTKRAEILAGADEAVAQKIAKTSLDGAYGRICCIGWAIADQAPQSLINVNERDVIAGFFGAIAEASGMQTHNGMLSQSGTFIGHSITGFDLRFLWQRAVVLGINRPAFIPFNVKPWDDRIKDTMTLWNPDRDKRISLDKLCKVLGVKSSKAGYLDGSKIAQAWADGRHAEIAEYCEADVVATRECYRRMMG